MELFQAFILAIIQGITEFLPISSSAHLILVPELLGWPASGLAFDVAVHVGTLIAVIVFLRKELQAIVIGWLMGFETMKWQGDGMLGWMLIAATLPVGLVGLLASDFIEAHLRTAFIIAMATLFFGLLLGWADRGGDTKQASVDQITWGHALVVGFAQAFALIPGTSRSGVTMTAMLALGYHRVAAARFSFLLAVPTILLPGLMKVGELANGSALVDWDALLIGVIVSAVVAFLSMRWFLGFVTRVGMKPFVIYRVILAAVILLLLV